MTIEFNLKNDETVTLVPFKVLSDNNSQLFRLLDELNNTWLELKFKDNNLFIESISEKIIDSKESIDSKLDQLLIDIIETEKSGTDSYGDTDSNELNPYDPEKIKVRSDKLPITLISQMIDDGDIDLNPDFQRNFVWNSFQKSRLIESILLRIPLPMFYFAEDKDGKLSVVDGLQRIATIKEFMDNKFPLRNLQYLGNQCNGRYYKDADKKKGIDLKYFRWFNLTSLSANTIDPTSPYKVKYDIFRRINTGGKPLNNQEIRNCLTGQGLRDALKEMVTLSEFKSATDNSIKSTRMEDQEIALRFLVFYELLNKDEGIDNYDGYMEAALDDYTERHIKSKRSELNKDIIAFKNSMMNAEFLIGKKHSFRKILPKDIEPKAYKQLINKALFVCTSILLAKYNPDTIKEFNAELSLQPLIANEIENNKELFNFLSYGTNGKANLLYTFKVLKEIITNNVKG